MLKINLKTRPKFKKEVMTLRKFLNDYIGDIDCQPVGQRLDTTPGPEKREGIIGAIMDGINIGEITICESPDNPQGFKFESIDGGHRKRYIFDYIKSKGIKRFKVRGRYFSELSQKEQNQILDYEITLVTYDVLDTFTKGYIFRTLNETTDVNDQETRNSFGDIDVANLIRESVRIVDGIWNDFHPMFEKTQQGNFRWLMFDNKRLKTEEYIARLVFRLTQEEYLGESSQTQLDDMYKDNDTLDIDKIQKELKEILDFLFKFSKVHYSKFQRGLSQQDFKMLSFLWMYMKDTYKTWKIEDDLTFLLEYKKAFNTMTDKDGKYGKILNDVDFDDKGRTIAEAFKGYLGAPHHYKKVKQTVIWLLGEFNIDDYIIVKDTKRTYTYFEKERKLLDQNMKCYITGIDASMEDMEAAHIVPHSGGGRSTYDNFVMVLKEHNRKMGSMNLHDYMNSLQFLIQH